MRDGGTPSYRFNAAIPLAEGAPAAAGVAVSSGAAAATGAPVGSSEAAATGAVALDPVWLACNHILGVANMTNEILAGKRPELGTYDPDTLQSESGEQIKRVLDTLDAKSCFAFFSELAALRAQLADAQALLAEAVSRLSENGVPSPIHTSDSEDHRENKQAYIRPLADSQP